MKHTQATMHDSKGLPSDKHENAQQSSRGVKRVSPLVSQLSLSGFASNLDVLQVGPTSSLKLVSVF